MTPQTMCMFFFLHYAAPAATAKMTESHPISDQDGKIYTTRNASENDNLSGAAHTYMVYIGSTSLPFPQKSKRDKSQSMRLADQNREEKHWTTLLVQHSRPSGEELRIHVTLSLQNARLQGLGNEFVPSFPVAQRPRGKHGGESRELSFPLRHLGMSSRAVSPDSSTQPKQEHRKVKKRKQKHRSHK